MTSSYQNNRLAPKYLTRCLPMHLVEICPLQWPEPLSIFILVFNSLSYVCLILSLLYSIFKQLRLFLQGECDKFCITLYLTNRSITFCFCLSKQQMKALCNWVVFIRTKVALIVARGIFANNFFHTRKFFLT